MSGNTAENSAPWYHHGWVWAVFAIPFSAVLFGVVMLVSAGYRPDDLVQDDYYKAGMGINQDLAADRRATEVGAIATLVSLNPEGAVFDITGGSDQVLLSLFHVTDSEKDLAARLVPQGDHLYTMASVDFTRRLSEPGIWYLEIRDETLAWRLRDRLVTPATTLELGGR